MNQEKRIHIITGHYGSGKTNIALNLANQFAAQNRKTTLVDLDIVNPYFRTSDFREELVQKQIKLIAPTYANTNLDLPALSPEIQTIFSDQESIAVIDVGGDDAGAIALGQFSSRIEAAGYELYYVINKYRYLTHTAKEAVGLLKEIEATSRLKVTAIINNSNLGRETTKDLILQSYGFAAEICELTSLPLAYTCCPAFLSDTNTADMQPIHIYTDSLWR